MKTKKTCTDTEVNDTSLDLIKIKRMQDKGQSVKKTTVPKSRVLLAEAECGVVGVPVVVQPVPVHHNLAAVPVEIRDNEVAVEILHDRAPQEDSLSAEELAEHSNAFGSNGVAVL